MICAPRQTILLCVAALTLNAAASELGNSPVKSIDKLLTGRTPLGFLSKDKAQAKTDIRESFSKLFQLDVKNSPGLTAAVEHLKKGDYAAFETAMNRTAGTVTDPGALAAQLFCAECAFQNKEWFKAYSLFLSVFQKAVPDQLSLRAVTGALNSLMQAGFEKEALPLLQTASLKFPGNPLWEKLEVYLLGRAGEHERLAARWAVLKEKFSHAPESLIFDGLFSGGESAAASQTAQTAAEFYAAAFNFAVDNKGRRNCLKKLIALQEKDAPQKALRTIDRFLLFFPRSSDAGTVKLKKGELQTGLKDFAGALTTYREILNDKRYKIGERVQAAFRAAAVSEKNGDRSMARELYNSAIRRFAAYPEFANQVKMQLLEFLIRTEEYSPAAVLGDELAGVTGVDQKRLSILRIKALSELKRYVDAAGIAFVLAQSADPSAAAEGSWLLAHLTELQKNTEKARHLYLAFAEKFPDDKRVPDALLAAIDFSVKAKDFSVAAEKVDEYLQKFPQHEGVEKAMFVAIFSRLRHEAPGNRENAEQMLKKMVALFPASHDSDAAVLELIRYFTRKNEHISALNLVEDFRQRRPSSTFLPEVLMLGGKTLEKMGTFSKAVDYVDLLLDKYPDSPWAVEAAMLGGSCCFQAGNYQRALKYYERACELGGRGVMAQVAAGEAADCHLQLRTKANLNAAIRIYRNLANSTEFPALQIQALYKLGVAYEYSNNNMKAIEAYEELLSLAVNSQKVRKSSGVALWCGRGARSALRIILGSSHLPDGSQRAQRIYRLYSLLDLPGSTGELKRYLEEIRKHYNLLD